MLRENSIVFQDSILFVLLANRKNQVCLCQYHERPLWVSSSRSTSYHPNFCLRPEADARALVQTGSLYDKIKSPCKFDNPRSTTLNNVPQSEKLTAYCVVISSVQSEIANSQANYDHDCAQNEEETFDRIPKFYINIT